MWLELLAALYNQALRNSTMPFGSDQTRTIWENRRQALLPLIELEMEKAKRDRAYWVQGYAMVWPYNPSAQDIHDSSVKGE